MKLKLPNFLRNLVKATSFWKDNQLILREFRYFKWVAIGALVFALIAAFLEGVTVGLITSFLQGLTNPNEPPIRTGIEWFDKILLATEASPASRVYRISALLLAATWLRTVFDYLTSLYSRRTCLNLVNSLRRRVFDQLESFQLRFYSTASPGELVSTIRGEITQVQQSFNILAGFFIQGSKLLAYLGAMVMLSWQLSLATALAFGSIFIGLNSLNGRVREASFDIPKANKAFTATTLSFINGIRTVHASGTQEFERNRYYKATREVFDSQLSVIKLSASVQPITQALGTTLLIGLVVVSYEFLISTEQLKSAQLLTFLFVLVRTTPLISALNSQRVSFVSAQGAMEAVKDLLRRDDKPYFQDGHKPFTHFQRSIDFESVDFAYNPGEPVLHDISLSIKKGETVALVGASGAGKTTLADLLPRFYDPTSGRILVDGVNLREFQINTFRKRMAIVSQDTFIFRTTVLKNIIYGVDNASESQILEAARAANALEFIDSLPEGFDTQLGERGIRLSGGQRQRIAIARALLRDPEILILDEATSALDSATEKLIQESLERLATGRTVIAIAHRLSTIANADKVVVLEKGRIVEQGRYKDLLEKRGKLWQYHQMQFELGAVS
jgi:subfamily B ATP-binding cassette protein MsbA